MNYVIGDIHGEISKLKLLLKNIIAQDKAPSFVFIGDYVDKGEDAYAVLEHLVQLSKEYSCVFLRGNHEYYWEQLNSENDEHAAHLIRYGGKNTVLSVGKNATLSETKKKLFSEFGSFFASLKNYHQTDKYVMTHSGIPPELYDTSIEKIPAEKLMLNRYDFIKQKTKYFDKIVIFGHTGFYSVYYDGYKIGIDTAACYLKEQPLTAFCTDEDFFINSDNQTVQLSSINQDVCPAIPRVRAWQQL